MKVSRSGALSRSRWAAIGAAIAVSIRAGGVAITHAVVSSGERAAFFPIAPCRLFDLRPAPDQVGPRSAPLGPGETFTAAVRGTNGNCTIPADATAVAMNVTTFGGTANSFLTIWPADVSPRPQASNLNWAASAPPTPNKVDVKLSATGSINLFNLAGSVGVLADVVGYYADHNHDDRYYTQTQANAQLATKANTADVYTKTQINGMPSSSVIGGGGVSSDGVVIASVPRFGTSWTATRTGAGSYTLTFPGVSPGCTGLAFPLVLVSGLDFTVGFQQLSGSATTQCVPGDLSVFVRTYNTAGTLIDRGFMFIAYRPGNNQILPTAPPSALAPSTSFTECTSYIDGRVECS
jgi:hypothetical protein